MNVFATMAGFFLVRAGRECLEERKDPQGRGRRPESLPTCLCQCPGQ